MDPRNIREAGVKVLYFIAQVIVLIASIAYLNFIYFNDILPDKEVKENFVQTNCTVNNKQLATRGHVVHSYRANFLVTYTVNGINYRSWVTGNGLDQAFFSDQDSQQAALDQFEINASYPCWYNPETPQIVVLVLRHDWASTLPLLIPSVLALIAAYYVLLNILLFFGLISHRTRD